MRVFSELAPTRPFARRGWGDPPDFFHTLRKSPALRNTEPNADQALLLQTLNLTLPAQPPPRIRAGQIDLPAAAPPP